MSEAEMNSYRLTSMEEPGDERMAQIMREVAAKAPAGLQSVWLLGLRLRLSKLVQELRKQ